MPFTVAWDWQRAAVAARLQAETAGQPSPDSLLVLQYQPVYTLGTGRLAASPAPLARPAAGAPSRRPSAHRPTRLLAP